MLTIHDFPVPNNYKEYTDRELFSNMCDLLYALGVTANYTGFYITAYAASLCARDPDMLRGITKSLYPQLGRQFNKSSAAVERNIRTVVNAAWMNNPALLERLAGRPLLRKPANAMFLAFLSRSRSPG